MSKLLQRIADKYKKRARQQLDGDITKTLNYTRNEMYNEAINMFDAFIDQFYSYITSVYIRHGEGFPGTGHGTNLYKGKQIRKVGTNYSPALSIEFSGMDMEGGYEYDSPGVVLSDVMSGIRFPEHGVQMTWSGEYVGKDFSYAGVPERAFEIFERNFDTIALDIFYEKWKDMGW